ncbi:MAG: alpha-mannosidase [Clostridia bacterium]|nr:alpha-mannosidase [Clostridia bacterium]
MQLTNLLKRLESVARSNRFAERIYAELLYLYHLNRARDLGWEDKLCTAAAYLCENLDSAGAIVSEDCEAIETALSDLSAEAKSLTIHCVAHAHIDMNWTWGYMETVSIATETFRTMLDLMRDYPDYTFSQSQAAVYEIVEKHDPSLLAEIRQRVHEGRWELAATSWVENDKNMPNAESLCRHILYTKEYLSRLFDVDPDTLRLDFEPDTFGHNANVPEILKDGGVDYYYHCRGCQPRGAYRWRAPSGKEVIAYSDPTWYQGPLDVTCFATFPQFGKNMGDGTLTEFIKVYGVGDHGGGPSRRDLEKLTDAMTWPLYPTLKFSRYDAYYAYLETVRDRLPVYDGELNFVFTGCYTAQSRIKLANRNAELRLYDAETLAAQAAILTDKLPQTDFTKGWTNTLFNQFHDILPGSGTIETREAALGQFQETLGYTNTASTEAMRAISAAIDTSALPYDFTAADVAEGSGAGFHIGRDREFQISCAERGRGSIRILHLFNTLPVERDEVVTYYLWDYPADLRNLIAELPDGTGVPLQLQDGNRGYYQHQFCTLLLRVKLPPMGYTTIVLKQRDAYPETAFNLPARPDRRLEFFDDGDLYLENEYIRADFDAETCALVSLIDKTTGKQLIAKDNDRTAATFAVVQVNPRFGHSSWTRGPVEKIDNINLNNRVRVSTYNRQALCGTISYDVPFMRSSMTVTIRLYAGSRTLDFDTRVNWLEVGNNDASPLLVFRTPVAYDVKDYRYEIAGGTQIRGSMPMDVPSIGRMELLPTDDAQESYVQLMADTKYGFRGWGNYGEISLIHASFQPDPYPELGQHHFHTAISVVTGEADAQKTSDCYHHAPATFSGVPQKGSLPLSGSALLMLNGDDITPATQTAISLSTVRVTAQGNLIIRLCNRTDSEQSATLILPRTIDAAFLCDITEQKNTPINIETDRSVRVTVDARAMQTLRIVLE